MIPRPKTMFPGSKHPNGLKSLPEPRPSNLKSRPPAQLEASTAAPNTKGHGATPKQNPLVFLFEPGLRPPTLGHSKTCFQLLQASKIIPNHPQSSKKSSQASQNTKTLKTQGSNQPKTQQFTKSNSKLRNSKNSKL